MVWRLRCRPPRHLLGGRPGLHVAAIDEVRLGLPVDDGLIDNDLAHMIERGQIEHRVEQHLLEDRAQTTRTGLSCERLVRDRGQCFGPELELDAFHVEEALELLGDRVLGLSQDLDQRRFVELFERRDNRQTTDELGNQTELDQVFRLHVGKQLGNLRVAALAAYFGIEADADRFRALLNDFLQPRECAADDEKNIARVDLQEFLLRMLAPALRRYRRDGAFNEFQERLLHAFAGHVARDRGVLALARDLVDLIDVDDAGLRFLDVVVALLQKLLDDVLDVLADIAGFGQRRRISDRERHVEKTRERIGQQRLARAGWTDEQNVGFGEFDFLAAPARFQPLVVVVDGDGENFLGAVLPDHILIEHVEDFLRLGQVTARAGGFFLEFLADDVVAELDALVADEHRRTGDQFAYFVL